MSAATAMTVAIMLVPNTAAAYYYNTYTWGGYNTAYAGSRTTAAPSTSYYNYTRPTSTTASTGTASSPIEQTLLSLLNQERSKYGLLPLQNDATLTKVARMKSQDMVAKHYFSHTSPTYGSPAQMLTSNGVRYSQYGENIAQGGDAYRIHAMWMANPEHRANMLRTTFTTVGIGLAANGSGYNATQLFIAR
jgi:uncharacterized protein YkwD